MKDQVQRNTRLFHKLAKALSCTSLIAGLCAVYPCFHSTMLQAQTAKPSPEGDTVGIVEAVKNAGQQVVLEDFQRWRGNRVAFKAVLGFLQVEPALGTDWRNAVDALAIVAGGDPELGKKALDELRAFAQDTHYFSSNETLPGAPVISEAAAAAKMEVPFAIAFLARAAGLHHYAFIGLHEDAAQLLHDAQSATYWKVQWANDVYFGDSKEGSERRSKLLAKHSIEAAARLPQPH